LLVAYGAAQVSGQGGVTAKVKYYFTMPVAAKCSNLP